ncbi:MAG: sigma-70 family RNA polymerase sigma factor, partial [Armatimonadetes bacterium]|nr:sigma-70 family RNA polymerase sigma factor [Armatimonadota bacterium]
NDDPAVCDDAALTRRAATGDAEVFGDIIRCYQDRILAAARARCGDPDDAQDVLQDTYVAAMRYLPGFRGEATVKGWLFRLAMSACTKKRRGRKNDAKLHVPLMIPTVGEGPPPLDLAGPGVDDPERQAAVSQSLHDVGEVLLRMRELDRATLLLVDGEGRRPAEAGELLGLTASAVKSRLHRARKILREAAKIDPCLSGC